MSKAAHPERNVVPSPEREISVVAEPRYRSGVVQKAAYSPFENGFLSGAEAVSAALEQMGVQHAFAIIGGGIAPMCRALHDGSIRMVHCRHEAGAAFAAIESSLASGRMSVVVCTTGPGLTNLLTGMVGARWEGAKVLFISGYTPSGSRGRWAFQETSPVAPGVLGLHQSGPLFHYASAIESPAELEAALVRIGYGAAGPGPFVAHLALPLSTQTQPSQYKRNWIRQLATSAPDPAVVRECVKHLKAERFAIWCGFGSRAAAPEVLALAELSGAPVMCTPRGKGAFPESHPQYLGTTGFGGHDRVLEQLQHAKVERVLVLGSRLGEMSSFWLDALVPQSGLIHVDTDPAVFGCAYPNAFTLGVQADCKAFLVDLLQEWGPMRPVPSQSSSVPPPLIPPRSGLVRPSYLMQEVQGQIVEGSTASIITEAGNSFSFCTHYLRFDRPGRYRVSTGFGSMGHASAGVLGLAMATGTRSVAILGDGAMLMLNEMNTAATYGIEALWIVLNDSAYGMIAQGMQSIGWDPFLTNFQRVDFAAVAQAMGVQARGVRDESELRAGLREAMAHKGPFLLDVWIDPEERAPTGSRNKSLQKQGVNAPRMPGADQK